MAIELFQLYLTEIKCIKLNILCNWIYKVNKNKNIHRFHKIFVDLHPAIGYDNKSETNVILWGVPLDR